MHNLPKLLNVAADVEIDGGFIYLCFDGKRVFAYPPHVARIANERIKRALDQLDRDNASKIVAFK